MTSGTWARRFKGTAARVCDMALVVGTVEVSAVPACWESDGRANPSSTLLQRQVCSVIPRAGCPSEWVLRDVGGTSVAELLLLTLTLAEHGVTNQHPEALNEDETDETLSVLCVECCTDLLERRDLCFPVVRRNVVDCDTLLPFQAQVDQLGNSLEASVTSLEVQIRRPVVGEVLAEGATGACAFCGGVIVDGWHACIECVSANYLMIVWCPQDSRVDQRIETFDGQTGTLETKHGCCRATPCGRCTLSHSVPGEEA